ncbi:MAG: DNA polymerase III subunit epsilon [Candidatus Omnitrophica bacterium]|nr:DNA polymerase III subunit epsilon [Candidatus Omnitrophota bacterium]
MLEELSLAIVDVETTGSLALDDRVIEVGLYRIERGRVAQTFSTLVNPERPIPPMITYLTGITDEDVAPAPAFGDIAGRLRQLLEGCVFVAHNAGFDYGFVRQEFARHRIDYAAERLCSVRLSRLLYPHHRHHNLGALIERFQFPCARRHRALDDAGIVWQFLQYAQQHIEAQRLTRAVRQLLKAPALPPGLTAADLEALPSGPGVYVCADTTGRPLLVGRSADVREHVTSSLAETAPGSRRARLLEQVARVEAHRTFGTLGTQLLHAQLSRRLAFGGASRRRLAIRRQRLPAWPYAAAVLVREPRHHSPEGHLFIVDQWRLVQALQFDDEGLSPWRFAQPAEDPTVSTILLRYLAANHHRVTLLTPSALEQLLSASLS